MGLHRRYEAILGENPPTLLADGEAGAAPELPKGAFDGLMRFVFDVGEIRPEHLADQAPQAFIHAHTEALTAGMKQVEMPRAMRTRLEHSAWVFSGFKTLHEMNEAAPSLVDENGRRKTFERFLKDVQTVNRDYNVNYLRAEYNYATHAAQMAARWQQFEEEGDRYDLEYRTAGDERVRASHRELDGIALPPSDPFWDENYPPNGWGCRCTAVQVRARRHTPSESGSAMEAGRKATGGKYADMFRYNPGRQGKLFGDYNPYTVRQCITCTDRGKGEAELAAHLPKNELCRACRILREVKRESAKNARLRAKPLQGKTINNPDFAFPVKISKRTLQEWTNQPFKYYYEKNAMLLNIEKIFAESTYLGTAENHKNVTHLVQSHIFETQVRGENALIIVREYDWGEYILHSLSEGGELYKHIEKEK